jgi:predicted Co/Zn/Cd cation transporter (cation efflux family)
MEQSVNQIIALKQFLLALNPVYEALANARTTLLAGIREVRSDHAYWVTR